NPVALGCNSQMLALTALRQIEGIAQYAIGAVAGEHRLLNDDLAIGIWEQAAPKVGVFAFSVLSHDIKVDIAGLVTRQRTRYAVKQAHVAQVDVLVKLTPELQQGPPQRDMIRHGFGPAHSAEEDGIERLQLGFPVWRHHFAMPLV